MGATQNSQSWSSAHPPANKAGAVERAGLTEVLVTGIDDQMDQGQAQTDGDWREARGRAAMGRAQDHEQECKIITISQPAPRPGHSPPGECSP